MDISIVSALTIMGGLGLVFGAGLAVASRVFAVAKDPRVEQIEAVLPGANCGACGAPGCAGFAEGVVEGRYPVSGCTAGGEEVARKIAEIMGTEAGTMVKKVAVVQCQGDREQCPNQAEYHGIRDCRAAVLASGGAKGCLYGCLGLGTCEAVCSFDAIHIGSNGLPMVDEEKCTACGECVRACPRDIITLLPVDQFVFIACKSPEFGKAVKSVCKVGCIGCSLCANPKTTPEGRIVMDGKLPVIQYDRVEDPWEDLKMAVEKCPSKSFGVRGTPPRTVEQEET